MTERKATTKIESVTSCIGLPPTGWPTGKLAARHQVESVSFDEVAVVARRFYNPLSAVRSPETRCSTVDRSIIGQSLFEPAMMQCFR